MMNGGADSPISLELRLALARNFALEEIERREQNPVDLALKSGNHGDFVAGIKAMLSGFRDLLFPYSHPENNLRPSDVHAPSPELDRENAAFTKLYAALYDGTTHRKRSFRPDSKEFFQALAEFHVAVDKAQPFGDETRLPLRLLTYFLARDYANAPLDFGKLTADELNLLSGTEGWKQPEKLAETFRRIAGPDEKRHEALWRHGAPPEHWSVKARDPRLEEDPRLLTVEKEIGKKQQICVLTCEGEYFPLKSFKKYLRTELGKAGILVECVDKDGELVLKKVPDEYLKIPRKTLEILGNPKLEGLEEPEKFLDSQFLGRDDKHYAHLFNTQKNIFTGGGLKTSHGPNEELAREVIQKAAAAEIEKIPPAPGRKVGALPGGTPGIGKGMVVGKIKRELEAEGFLLLERDGFRRNFFLYQIAKHPDVQAHADDYKYTHDFITRYHEEALKQAIAKGVHIIRDGALGEEKYLKQFEMLNKAGYETEAHFVTGQIETGLRRNAVRFHEEGRLVPPGDAAKTGINVMRNIVKFIMSPHVHKVTVTDNGGEKGEEKLIAETALVEKDELARLNAQIRHEGGEKFIVVQRRDEPRADGKIKILKIHDEQKLAAALAEARRYYEHQRQLAHHHTFDMPESPLDAGFGEREAIDYLIAAAQRMGIVAGSGAEARLS